MPDQTATIAEPGPAQHRKALPPGPCCMVIFGAGGDLTKRLLIPALYNLSHSGLLPEHFAIVGVDLADMTADSWRDELRKMLDSFVGNASSEEDIDKVDTAAWNNLAGRMSYLRGDLTDADMYTRLGEHIEHIGGRQQTGGNCLFYLAVADRFFGPIVEHLGQAKLVEQGEPDGQPKPWRRVVIEKPFGHDHPSAIALNQQVLRVLNEDQIYRIDHFLGKETVQNIMAFRFANGMFEPIWNRDRIDHVQITVSETVGVEGRGKFYEHTGALRDMVPNHVFQLLAMVAMEPPGGFDAEAIRSKKADVFSAMKSLTPDDAVRGQYGPGKVLGKDCVAYRAEPDVAPESAVETYVAMRLHIDNWRWAGVPFYLRTGKHMPARNTEIAIRFKHAPFTPFADTPVDTLPPNWLVLQVQPDEGISMQFEVKRPGPLVDLAPVRMNFLYSDWFDQEPSVGYETLIYDCMIGDQTLFQRADQVEAAWRVVQPVLDEWGKTKLDGFPNYASGSDGPAAASEMMRHDGRRWRPVVPMGGGRK